MDTPVEKQNLPAVVAPKPAIRPGRKVASKKYAPAFIVVLPDFTTVEVPIDKASSDAQRSILVAKTRTFVEEQLEKLKDKTLTPQEVKDMVKAVTDLDGLQREQFVTSLNNSGGKNSPLGSGLQDMLKSAAQGAAEGTAQGFLDKMQKMDKAAKKVEAAEPKVIDV